MERRSRFLGIICSQMVAASPQNHRSRLKDIDRTDAGDMVQPGDAVRAISIDLSTFPDDSSRPLTHVQITHPNSLLPVSTHHELFLIEDLNCCIRRKERTRLR